MENRKIDPFGKLQGKVKELKVPPIDKTLTKEGQTADAKAVGDAIKKLNTDAETLDSAVKEVETEISSVKGNVTKLDSDLAVERKRINNLTANTGEQTEGNAELLDIRVDFEGNTHETAGEAVRAQVSQVSGEIGKLEGCKVDYMALGNSAYNRIDYEVEQGSYGASTGDKIGSTKLVRTKDFIIPKEITILKQTPGLYSITIFVYSSDGVYEKYETASDIYTFDVGKKYKIAWGFKDGTNCTPDNFDYTSAVIAVGELSVSSMLGIQKTVQGNITDNIITPSKCTFFEKGSNLLNKETIISGKSIDQSTGQETENSTICISDFIEVKGGEKYTYVDVNYVFMYTPEKAYVKCKDKGSISGDYLPINIGFVRVSMNNSASAKENACVVKAASVSQKQRFSEKIKREFLPYEPITDKSAQKVYPLSWIVGTIGATAGADIGSTSYCRSKEYIIPEQKCTVFVPEKYRYNVFQWDLEDNYIGYRSEQGSARYELKQGYKYRLCIKRVDGTNASDFVSDLYDDIIVVDKYITNNMMNNRYFAKLPWRVQSHYIPTIAQSEFDDISNSVKSLKPSEIYAMYDSLVSDYPNLITRESMGKDATGTYDVYRYTFTPEEMFVKTNHYNETVEHPTVLLFTSTHGWENVSTWTLARLMKEIYTNWQSNELLEFLRFNVRFVIIPVVNPYGLANNSRYNGNGVDINRNYDWRWSESTQTVKGNSAFSEPETQYVRDTLLAHKDCLFALDYHTNGSIANEPEANKFYWDTSPSLHTLNLKTVAGAIAQKMTVRLRQDFGYTGNELLGYIIDDALNPKFGNYCAKIGIEGCNPEILAQIPGENITRSPNVFKVGVEYIGNLLNYAINVFTE